MKIKLLLLCAISFSSLFGQPHSFSNTHGFPRSIKDSLFKDNFPYTGIEVINSKLETTPYDEPFYFEYFYFKGRVTKIIARYGSFYETRTSNFPLAYEVNISDQNEICDTLITEYNIFGKKKSETRLKNGLLHGQMTTYFPNGVTQAIEVFRNGVNTFRIGFWENGNIKFTFNRLTKNKPMKMQKYSWNGSLIFECEYKDNEAKIPIKGTCHWYEEEEK